MSTTTYTDLVPSQAKIGDFADMVEIDQRTADGIEVRLLWHPVGGDVAIAVFDRRTEEQFAVRVDTNRALDAFRHPFAYAGPGPTGGSTTR
jgi:hypothetical protein